MTRNAKWQRKLKRRAVHATAARRSAIALAQPVDGPAGDEPLESMELLDAGRVDIERVDEHAPEPIDSITETGVDDGSTGAIEAATADPAQAQAPPHLVER
jgi:hypothetical protein